jgi:hypothetical protein
VEFQPKYRKTFQLGFDDVALLGSIWNTNQPIQNFKLCQKIAHLYCGIVLILEVQVLADCKTFEQHEVYGWLLIRQTQSRQKTISMK